MSLPDSAARLSRRRFLLAAAGTSAAVALASALSGCGPGLPQAGGTTASTASTPAAQAGPGGFNGGGSLKLLLRAHFVPAYDKWMDQWAADWGARNKVEVQVDHILAGELAAKIAAEVAASAGHDIYGLTRTGEAPLYNKQLVDVSDIARQVGDQHGGWIPLGEQVGLVDGVWKAVPEYFVDYPGLYRKDLFDDNGLNPPDTWPDLRKAGALLKSKGFPIGIAVNQKSNDANASWNGLLWSYGASTVAADGKTVALNSPETREALTFAVDLYQSAMTNAVLSWDDTGNNLLLASGTGSWIQNPISALRTIEKETPDLAKKIFLSNPPAGPKGRHMPVAVNSFGIASWSSNVPAAKAFLTSYYQILAEGIRASEGYNQPLLKDFRKKPMPILGEDPKLELLQDFDQFAHVAGWPGPPSAAAGEVESNWIVPLMVARAAQDGNVDGAVEWATQKVEAIYARH